MKTKKEFTPLQQAFEEASKEPYGFKNHLPAIWKEDPEFEVDKINRYHHILYNIILNQLETTLNNLYKK